MSFPFQFLLSLLLLLTTLPVVGFHLPFQIKSTPPLIVRLLVFTASQYCPGKIIRLNVLGAQGREQLQAGKPQTHHSFIKFYAAFHDKLFLNLLFPFG